MTHRYSANEREPFVVRAAVLSDVEAIRETLVGNAADASLFQQSSRRIRRDIADFIIVTDGSRVVGCAAVHRHTAANAEILAVAVNPLDHGRGAGAALMNYGIASGTRSGATFVWLATEKPDYFERFGFQTISMWHLPTRAIHRKVRLVFEQPVGRWLPALRGRHTFMRLG